VPSNELDKFLQWLCIDDGTAFIVVVIIIIMATEGKAIVFYCCNLFYFFISLEYMKYEPLDLNQTWPVGQKWCGFTNAPKNFGATLPQIWGAKTSHFGPLFRNFGTQNRISPQ